ncbi:MAG: hypothetical protein K1X54_08640 [Flavobacteriales bacterium]|nr:hypothetical protein [Flavobacteriales bacterium]
MMNQSSVPQQPKKWKMALLIWLFIYPVITILFYVLSPWMMDWPPFLRTLLLTLILVPLMVFVALPFIHKKFFGWVRR